MPPSRRLHKIWVPLDPDQRANFERGAFRVNVTTASGQSSAVYYYRDAFTVYDRIADDSVAGSPQTARLGCPIWEPRSHPTRGNYDIKQCQADVARVKDMPRHVQTVHGLDLVRIKKERRETPQSDPPWSGSNGPVEISRAIADPDRNQVTIPFRPSWDISKSHHKLDVTHEADKAMANRIRREIVQLTQTAFYYEDPIHEYDILKPLRSEKGRWKYNTIEGESVQVSEAGVDNCCPICRTTTLDGGKPMISMKDIRSHLATHAERDAVPCRIWGLVNEDKNLESHLQQCEDAFRTVDLVWYHMRGIHKVTQEIVNRCRHKAQPALQESSDARRHSLPEDLAIYVRRKDASSPPESTNQLHARHPGTSVGAHDESAAKGKQRAILPTESGGDRDLPHMGVHQRGHELSAAGRQSSHVPTRDKAHPAIGERRSDSPRPADHVPEMEMRERDYRRHSTAAMATGRASTRSGGHEERRTVASRGRRAAADHASKTAPRAHASRSRSRSHAPEGPATQGLEARSHLARLREEAAALDPMSLTARFRPIGLTDARTQTHAQARLNPQTAPRSETPPRSHAHLTRDADADATGQHQSRTHD